MRAFFALLALAATAATVAMPALAKSDLASGNDTVVLTKAADGTYCASTMITGSLLPYKICRTRAEWIADGARVQKARS